MLRRECGDIYGESAALRWLAQTWQGLGNHHKVIEPCRESIALGTEAMTDSRGIAESLDTLAISLQQTGHVEEAISCLARSSNTFRAPPLAPQDTTSP
jgi:hypothetical protein